MCTRASMILQDPFWKYVAKATKKNPVHDSEEWLATATNLTFGFLLDDTICDSSCICIYACMHALLYVRR